MSSNTKFTNVNRNPNDTTEIDNTESIANRELVANLEPVSDAPNTVPVVNDFRSEADNASLSSSGTDYTSLQSSVLDYEYENGRRYQNYRRGEYLLPNDEDEQDRMDFLHHIYGMILSGELHVAPIGDVHRVLDIGTGTGIWAMDFADQHPAAEVIGNDLSPIQPGWVPANCVFEVDDFEAEWQYSRPFDYIHGRELAGSIKDINHLAVQAFNNLKPRGYFELQSFAVKQFSDDGSLEKKGPFTIQLAELIKEAGLKFGKPMQDIDTWGEALKSAGFIDIITKVVKAPLTAWPKDEKQKRIGRFLQSHTNQALGSYLPGILTTVLGWAKEEVDLMAAKVRNELADQSIHQYGKVYFIYGKRP
ncbi:hypothetical protein ASPZODRAFT_18678 [Penicilliopsis zonata CBS 506.65]|uniref:Methyltransferase domain-containing protein n=1 Tax=Penicilliopsis zonata CBS 506.65 TaxID=1073090 RepID=A0A1L9SBF7_9EURO|nr:hypothetical protein ASPZODRAFT_18678 [Penicilliopsis zonata CBS 506.65]OJJ44488.1 hypothetical protein ASPZODRAFT_18678 [Penicilliopsis zonata CBS 506.65]